MRFTADLHVHTALSPCAAEEMTPPAIVARALELGLDMIAICDHNTGDNAAAVAEAAEGRLTVLAGIEVTTAEEIHVVGLFPSARGAEAVGREVQATLPAQAGTNRRLLATGCGLDLAGVVALIHGHAGVAVAAHVDRPSFSVIAQLGFWPQDAGFDAVEVSAAGAARLARGQAASLIPDSRFQIPEGLPVVCGSDAHSLDELGAGRTVAEMEEATFEELVAALRSLGGRRCGRA
jgi:3',5'-nucleoside bisphosphate phosphatase